MDIVFLKLFLIFIVFSCSCEYILKFKLFRIFIFGKVLDFILVVVKFI